MLFVMTMIVAQAHLEQCDPIQQAQNSRFVREWFLWANYNAVQFQTWDNWAGAIIISARDTNLA